MRSLGSTLSRVKTESLSVQSLESAAMDDLFRRGLKLRLYLAPFIFLSIAALLAWDPAPWRRVAVVAAVCMALGRLVYEFFRAKKYGIERTRLSALLPVPALLLIVVLTVSGGVDSPMLPILPMVTVFVALFISFRFAAVFAVSAAVLVCVLAVLAQHAAIPALIPEAFGGGTRSSPTDTMLFARAFFGCVAVLWGVAVGWVMRVGFHAAIRKAIDAREEVLRTHVETTRTLTTLAAEIAHELKNPLASVKGLAALVDRDVDGKAKERIEVLRREVDRMQEILESFLTYTRPVVPLDVAPVKLSSLVEEIIALHEGVSVERSVSFRLDARPDVEVKADAKKLKQVLINLVQNALDVTPAGGVIDVVVAREAGGARISVMDRGTGVDDVERAFQPGHTTKEKGSGLGLTVSRLVARQHGGDVSLVQREGGGTLAALSLPHAPAVP
ncbi:MAG: sensor histidine kinase [Archangium sp.]